MPEISIALITYNGEKYIREQLDSILNQTIQIFEIVICDDCSADSTRDILLEYAKKDLRIVLNFNERNLGFAKNIEKAIKLCKGEFIALADQDDIWEKEHLSILHSHIGDNLLACGDSLLVDEKNNSLDIRFGQMCKIDVNSLKNNNEHLLRLLIMINIFQGAAMMLNRKFADITLPLPNDIKHHDLWFPLCAMALNKFIYVPIVVIRHRRHSNNVTQNAKILSDSSFWYKKEYMANMQNLCLSESSKQIIEQANLFFINKMKLSKYHKMVSFWVKNYRILYATNSKSRFLIRFWKNIIVQPLRRFVEFSILRKL